MKKWIAYMLLPHYLAGAVALSSVGILAAAYISQYGFHMDPCQLCFYQRKPYMVNIALGIAAFFLSKRHRKAALVILALSAISFLVNAGIAGFHVGVEQHWWKGLESCSNYALPEGGSMEELKKFITTRNVVRCDVPAFVLLGISMAGYNFVLSLLLGIGTLLFVRTSWRAQ